MTTAHEIVIALGGRWHGHHGMVQCPSHDDKHPSCSVTDRDGKVLVRCFGGCSQEAVIDALKARGLWHEHDDGNDDGVLRHPTLGKPDLEFRYFDADGNLIGAVCRWNARAGRNKEVRPAVFDGGKWRWKAFPDPRPLYCLSDVIAQPHMPILIVEGEKAVDAAREVVNGCCIVSTWAGGAGAVQHADLSPLKDRDVILWPDHDAPGRKAMNALADRLAGDARSVRCVKVPDDLPPGWDLGDALPADLDPIALIGCAVNVRAERLVGLGLIAATTLLRTDFKPPRWAVPGLIPEGLSIIAGSAKVGKSWLVLDLCAAVGGGALALGSIECEIGDVLYIALEDTPRRLAARLRAVLQGAPPPSRLTVATSWRRADDGGLADLRAWLVEHPQARLVVIDTLALIRGKPDRDQGVYAGDYAALSPFKQLADEFGVAIGLVHHKRKEGTSDPLASVSGTQGLTGSADTILVLDRQPRESTGMLYLRGRDVAEDEIALQFEGDTGRWLKLGAAEDFRKSEERRAVIRLLHQTGDAMTPAAIADALGRRSGTIRMLISKMNHAGEVHRLPNGKYYVLKA